MKHQRWSYTKKKNTEGEYGSLVDEGNEHYIEMEKIFAIETMDRKKK